MTKYLLPFLIITFFSCGDKSQVNNGDANNSTSKSPHNNFGLEKYYKGDNPFRHGVASGDPLADAVIIWTRFTPKFDGDVTVGWEISKDSLMKSIEQKGEYITGKDKDYTVKPDVKNLSPRTYYYYRFSYGNYFSPVGRTKTAPAANEKPSCRLAFASCSNFTWGYFNAYKKMAADSLDAVVHLGDYIYEYGAGVYGDSKLDRVHIPDHELLSLNDYRTRYAQYRLDEDLQNVHAKHAFITIWDDHEFANNAYDEGAQNHQAGEGDWKKRMAAAKKAYYEWLPVRENKEDNLYRSFGYGKMMRLIMLDTRVGGREKQPGKMQEIALDTNRKIISAAQLKWLDGELSKEEEWKIVGNQVLFGPLKVFFDDGPGQWYLDGWDAYPNQKKKLLQLLGKRKDAVIVTGDFHSTFVHKVGDVRAGNFIDGGIAEFVVPSITSANYDEDEGVPAAKKYEQRYKSANANLKYCNLTDHGYFVLSIKNENEAEGEFTFMQKLNERSLLILPKMKFKCVKSKDGIQFTD